VSGSRLSAFAQRQLFRSKYHVFRKHYGAAYARATYYSDRLLFGLSLLKSRSAEARALREAAKRGWRESFTPAAALRARPSFFEE
jgi:hypothetical protein